MSIQRREELNDMQRVAELKRKINLNSVELKSELAQ
jgi:hypothetical protein